MYRVAVRDRFSAAHRLREHGGKCEALHGHNWEVEVEVEAPRLDGRGLVVDFALLKERLRGVLEELDHTFLNELPPFRELNPTSEHLARYIFERLRAELPIGGLRRVTVWESPGSCATYLEDR